MEFVRTRKIIRLGWASHRIDTKSTGEMTGQSETYLALGRALAGIASARTRSSIWTQTRRLSEHFGLGHLLVLDVNALEADETPVVIHSDLQPRAMGAIHGIPASRNPLLLRSLSEARPFLLSDLQHSGHQHDIEWRDLLPDDGTDGDGLVAPVFDNAALKALVIFVGKPNQRDGDAARALLQSLAYAIHARLRDVAEDTAASETTDITNREAECLHWLEEGNSDEEIAAILGISKRTVRFHLDNLKKKFGVTRRTQVLAKRLKGTLEP